MRRLLILSLLPLVITGCAMPKPGASLKDSLFSTGTAQPQTQASAPAPGSDGEKKLMFFNQYMMQCRAQLAEMKTLPTAVASKDPEEVCNCVSTRMWEIRQKGQNADDVAGQKEMMACMGIDIDNIKQRAEQQRARAEAMEQNMIRPQEIMAEPAEDFPGQWDHLDDEESGKPAQPAAKRNVKYDPKTGTWSNNG